MKQIAGEWFLAGAAALCLIRMVLASLEHDFLVASLNGGMALLIVLGCAWSVHSEED